MPGFNYQKELMMAFPNIGLFNGNFIGSGNNLFSFSSFFHFLGVLTLLQDNYWSSIENRKRTYLELSKRKGFDPYITTFWYDVKNEDFASLEVQKKKMHFFSLIHF